MDYIELIGDFSTAYADVLANGGQLYTGNGNDSANVVVRGKKCFTYWKADSKRRSEVQELAKMLNISLPGLTGGRVCRWLIDELLALPYQNTYWQKNWRLLAKSGVHWHYSTVTTRKYFWGVEFDLKSAYFSSLFAGKSLLWDNSQKWMNDNGALENLKYLTPSLPKWFRLQLLGTLASWRMFFFCRDSSNKSLDNLVLKTRHCIKYNASFNCSHRAILRNYKIMKRIHEIGKDYIMRMHTDSFTLNVDCPSFVEAEIFDYISSKGLEYDIKAAGYGYFFDLNSGYVGRKFIGSKIDVTDTMREQGIKMKRDGGIDKVMDRFRDKVENSSFDINKQQKKDSSNTKDCIQLELCNPEQLPLD